MEYEDKILALTDEQAERGLLLAGEEWWAFAFGEEN